MTAPVPENGKSATHTDEELPRAEVAVEVQAPKKIGGKKRRAAPTPGEDAPELAAAAGGSNSLDLLAAEESNTIKVERMKPSKEGGSTQTGSCGEIDAQGEDLSRAIEREWGGGEYRVTGFLSDGRPATKTLRIPGPSRSLTEDDPSMDEYEVPTQRYSRSAPYEHSPYGPPGYQAPPGPYMPPQAGPPSRPDWYNTAFNPNSRVELDALKDRLTQLQRDYDQEKMAHAATRGQLEAAREQARSEATKREMEARFGPITAQLEALRSGLGRSGGNEAQQMFMQLIQHAQTQSSAQAERENAARRAEAENFRAMMQQQVSLLSKGHIDPTQMMANMMTAMQPIIAATRAPTADPMEMLERLDRMRSGRSDEDDDPEEPPHPAVAFAQAALEAVQTWRAQNQLPAANPPQALPGPAPQAQSQGDDMTDELKWLALIKEVSTYITAGDSPHTAAHKLAAWANGTQSVGHVQKVMVMPIADLAQLLESKAGEVKMSFLPEIKKELETFARILRDPGGAQWVQQMVSTLKTGK